MFRGDYVSGDNGERIMSGGIMSGGIMSHYRIRAMGRLVDKFGLYTRHLREFIDNNKNSKVRATVKGNLDKLLDSQVLLRSAFLKDLLTPAKIFSLVTQKQDPDEKHLSVQREAVEAVYSQFFAIEVFKNIDQETVTDGYIEIVRYCRRYFNVENSNQTELWHKVLLASKDRDEWLGVSLISEICLCTPSSNATLERFFNYLKIAKTDQRTRLSATSLNSVLRIKMRQLSHTLFHDDEYADKVLSHWYNEKDRRVNQKKRKPYKKRVTSTKSREQFDVSGFTCDAEDIVSTDDDSVGSDDDGF